MSILDKTIILLLIISILFLSSSVVRPKPIDELTTIVNTITTNITTANNLNKVKVVITKSKDLFIYYDQQNKQILISSQAIILSSSVDELSYLLSESLSYIYSECIDLPCIIENSLTYMEKTGYNINAASPITAKLLNSQPDNAALIERVLILETLLID